MDKNKVVLGQAPPLGLLYLGRILENEGAKVNVIDFSAEKYVPTKLNKGLNSVDAVGITVLSDKLNITKKIITQIRDKDPDIPIIIGGPHCTLFPKGSLEETGADISVQGDGEKAIIDIRKALKNKIKISEIPGIFYKSENKIKSGKKFKFIKNLDSLPFPARHLVEKYIYGRTFNKFLKPGEFSTIHTARGCLLNCRFCSQCNINLNQYRARSVKSIFKELKEMAENGYRHIGVMDDTFLLDKKQAHEIFDLIIKEKIDLKFYITGSYVNSADKKLYQKMKKAGVIYMHYDLISGDQSVLDFYNYKTTIENINYAINLSHNMGFFSSGTFLLGAPIETLQNFENTVNFSKSLPLDRILFTPLRYIAGSDLWFKAVEEGKILKNEYYVFANSRKNLCNFSFEKILQYCKKAQYSFYYRPKYLIYLLKNFVSKKTN